MRAASNALTRRGGDRCQHNAAPQPRLRHTRGSPTRAKSVFVLIAQIALALDSSSSLLARHVLVYSLAVDSPEKNCHAITWKRLEIRLRVSDTRNKPIIMKHVI